MYNHNKAQQSKNREHISWDILYIQSVETVAKFRYGITKSGLLYQYKYGSIM